MFNLNEASTVTTRNCANTVQIGHLERSVIIGVNTDSRTLQSTRADIARTVGNNVLHRRAFTYDCTSSRIKRDIACKLSNNITLFILILTTGATYSALRHTFFVFCITADDNRIIAFEFNIACILGAPFFKGFRTRVAHIQVLDIALLNVSISVFNR